MDEECVLNVQGGARIAAPATLDCLSTYILREQEDWFEDEIRFVRRWLRPGMQAVDVGANIGVYTVAMAQAVGSGGRVWAFEPTPAAAHFLERSIGVNGFRNVVVSRTAVSDREGSIAFSVGAHSELNSVAKPGGASGDVVQVRTATLDRMAADCGWTNVDLVKVDVEGHEFEAIAGGKKFLGENSPLLMFEIKADNSVDLRVLEPLAELGYEFYRLLPGPLFLVPFDPASADPSDLLNAFACKPDRAERIAAAGLLVQADAARVAAGRAGLAGGGAAAAYLEGLAAHAHSREETRGSSERYAWLSHSLRCVARALEAEPSLPKRISYARITGELAMRVASIQTLAAIDWLAADWQGAVAEPFLAPAERQEAMRPDGDDLEWLNCCVVEQWEKVRTYSSVFAGQTSLQVIAPIRGLSSSAEMERRWQLVRMRHGMQAGPEPADVLRRRTSENLNPEYWCAGTS